MQLVQNRHTKRGSRQRIIVSLGTNMHIPKDLRATVARLVEECPKSKISITSEFGLQIISANWT